MFFSPATGPCQVGSLNPACPAMFGGELIGFASTNFWFAPSQFTVPPHFHESVLRVTQIPPFGLYMREPVNDSSTVNFSSPGCKVTYGESASPTKSTATPFAATSCTVAYCGIGAFPSFKNWPPKHIGN